MHYNEIEEYTPYIPKTYKSVQPDITLIDVPEIHVKRSVLDNIMCLVIQLAENNLEIGGLLKVEWNPCDNEFHIVGFNVINQDVSSGEFTISQDALGEFLSKSDIQDVPYWNSWWHSHHNMNTFWSTTDDEAFSVLRPSDSDGFVLGIVFNSSYEFRVRIDLVTQFGTLVIDDLQLQIEEDVDTEYNITDGVSEPKVTKELVTQLKHSVESHVQTEKEPVIRDILKHKDIWDGITYPKNLIDIQVLASIHSTVFKDWTIEHECIYWGIDYEEYSSLTQKERIDSPSFTNYEVSV